MQPRLKRYKNFIDNTYFPSLLCNKQYAIEFLTNDLKRKIKEKKIDKILFTGMGCSAIVSDIIKGFFAAQKIAVHIEVVNDYDVELLINVNELKKQNTLVIVSSYSGHSQEPIKAYLKIKQYTNNIIFLTSGGELAQIAYAQHISLVRWQLKQPDREYPLFHAPQYFVILLDLLFELGFIASNYQKQISVAAKWSQKALSHTQIINAQSVALQLRNKDIILLASAKWYISLLKLVKMHINEMAMAPAHRNFVREFGHSEVGVLTSPKQKQALWLFVDGKEDVYTKNKMRKLVSVLTKKIPQNKNVTVVQTMLGQTDFFKQFFYTLQFVQYVVYFLGVYYNFTSRELISTIAGNMWYSAKTIEKEKNI